MYNKQKKGDRHRLSAECFTICTKWKLNVTVSFYNNSTCYVKFVYSRFFKEMVYSLNIFKTVYCKV